MPSFTISIDDQDVRRLLARFSPEQLDRRSRAAMQESVAYLQHEVQDKAPVGATSLFRGSVFTEVRGRAVSEMRGIVASPLDYAQYVERGRKPGKFPPRGPIELWAQRVLGDAKLWFVVARSIARKGTKATHVFRNAAQNGRAVVQRIWRRHFTV